MEHRIDSRGVESVIDLKDRDEIDRDRKTCVECLIGETATEIPSTTIESVRGQLRIPRATVTGESVL